MASHAIAYFAVIGNRNNSFKSQLLASATQSQSVHPSEVWKDAITDITVIFFGQSVDVFYSIDFFPILEKEETVPNEDGEGNGPIQVTISGKEWELIRYTVDGLGANCNSGDQSRGVAYLGIQRRKASNRLDHICQVSIVLPSSPSLPQGPSPEPSD
jgi:hypothetical protein